MSELWTRPSIRSIVSRILYRSSNEVTSCRWSRGPSLMKLRPSYVQKLWTILVFFASIIFDTIFCRYLVKSSVTKMLLEFDLSCILALYTLFLIFQLRNLHNLSLIVPRSTDRVRPVYVISVDVNTHFLTDFTYNWVGIIRAIFTWYIVKSKRGSPSILLKVFKTKFQITNSCNKFRVGFFQFFYCILLIFNCFHEWLDTAVDDELYRP